MIEHSTARQRFSREDSLVPYLRSIGWSRFSRADRQAHPPHHHGSAYEVHFLERGRMDVLIEGQVHSLRAGQVLVTRPEEVHAGVGGVLQQSEFYWVQLDADHLPTELEKLLSQCANRRHYPASPKTPELMRDILDQHLERDELSAASAKALTDLLVVDLARAVAPGSQPLSEPVRKCVELFRADLASPMGFSTIARQLGVSPSYLNKHFHLEVGESPAKWFLHERLDVASRMLLEGTSTTRIAKSLGYSTSQNFATTFLREMGMTPSQYRACVAELALGVALPTEAPLLD